MSINVSKYKLEISALSQLSILINNMESIYNREGYAGSSLEIENIYSLKEILKDNFSFLAKEIRLEEIRLENNQITNNK